MLKNVYDDVFGKYDKYQGENMTLKKQLGEKIKSLRQKCGLKQSELAERVGIAAKYQSCVEVGKNYPSAELIEKYAKVFGIKPAEVLYLHIKKSKETLQQEILTKLNSASVAQMQATSDFLDCIIK